MCAAGRQTQRLHTAQFAVKQRTDSQGRPRNSMGSAQLIPQTVPRCFAAHKPGVPRKLVAVHKQRTDCARSVAAQLDSQLRSCQERQQTVYEFTRNRRRTQERNDLLQTGAVHFQHKAERRLCRAEDRGDEDQQPSESHRCAQKRKEHVTEIHLDRTRNRQRQPRVHDRTARRHAYSV